MLPDLLSTGSAGLQHDRHDVDVEDSLVTFILTAIRSQARCPLYAKLSSRVKSRYQRTVADLP